LPNHKSEYEVPGGFIDIALLPNNRFHVGHYGLIEVKHMTQEDYEKKGDGSKKSGKELAQQKLEEAKIQLNRYSETPELALLHGLKTWALVFAGHSCVLNETIKP